MTSTPYTARAALRVVKELVDARRIVGELAFAAQENSIRIANVDEDRIVSPDADKDALSAAWALERSLDKVRDIITDALAVYMFGRDEDRDELVIRLEEEVREAGDAELVAYEDKVVRAIQVEGYIDRPRYLLDRYPETIRIGLKSGVGPRDCALQILDSYNEGVPEQAAAAIQAGLHDLYEVKAGLDNEDAIVAAIDACHTKEDLQDVLNRVIAACAGNEPSFDADDFSSDFIAALADGTVLAWGQEGSHRGHGTRAILIYTNADNAREIVSLDGSAELVDEAIAREAA